MKGSQIRGGVKKWNFWVVGAVASKADSSRLQAKIIGKTIITRNFSI